MKTNTKIVQLTLVSIGVLLILATYFLYPKISKNKWRENKIKTVIWGNYSVCRVLPRSKKPYKLILRGDTK